MITYEEWWAYEGKRRKERPYTPKTSRTIKRGTCKHYEQKPIGRHSACSECRSMEIGAVYDKIILTRTPY